MSRLLVIDDEQNVLYSLEKGLQSDTMQVLTARTARQGLEMIASHQPDTVILDVRLPDLSGLEAFDRIRQLDARLPVIVITAYSTTETAIEAMKRGAFEYLLKPVDFYQLREIVGRALELRRLSHVPATYEQADYADQAVDHIVGRSAVMQEIYKDIGRVAPQDVNVLICGESGTGKELVARAVLHHSSRSQAPFLAINCAAIPEALLESELFGHERGAFTGADRRRIGKFEQATGGTILLDEIGDMSYPTQTKVLRLLQDQCFERVGGNERIQTDVRVIAVTNQNLEEMVAANRFRKDLFYRLKVFTIHLPPLRQRMDDVPLLVEHFIHRYNREMARQVRVVAPETMLRLLAHHWPGNVRELQSEIKSALLHASGEILTLDCLSESLRHADAGPRPESLSAAPSFDLNRLIRELLATGEADVYRKICLAVDRIVLDEVLIHSKGNQVQASEILGISRTTLRGKLRALGLAIEKQLLPESGRTDQ